MKQKIVFSGITPEMVKDIQWDVNNTWKKTKSDTRHYLGYR